MLLLMVPSFFQLAYLSAACIGGYWLYTELTTGRRRRRSIKKHGCRPARRVKTRDPVLGLDAVFAIWKWSDQHILIEKTSQMLFGSGIKTVEFNFLRYISIFTIEAENIKSVFSQNFKSFRKGEMTKEIDLLLHGGIFINEGEAWHQSRELLRPSFARSQIADLDMLEKHVSTLIGSIPRDGSTVDLSKLFSKLTLSTAIEYLFGNSSNEGDQTAGTASQNTFTEVWSRVSRYLANDGEGDHGILWLYNFVLNSLRMNPKYRRDCHKIHGECGITVAAICQPMVELEARC